MTAIHERHRNNVRAGVLMLAAITMVIGVIAVLKDWWGVFFSQRNEYVVRFYVKDGVKDLTAGSPVRVGGLPKGSVVHVALDFNPQPLPDPSPAIDGEREEEPTENPGGAESNQSAQKIELNEAETEEGINVAIDVTFELDDDVTLYRNARAYVSSALIGSGSAIEIVSIGGGEGAVPLGPPTAEEPNRNHFEGEAAGTLLAALIGPKGERNTNQILDDFAGLTGRLEQDYEERLLPILDNANEAMVDLKEVLARINEDDWPRWAANVDRILDNALSSSESLELAIEDGRRFIDDGRALVANADGGVTDLRAMINDNRPSVDEFIENIRVASADVQELADRLAHETADKVDALLDRGVDAVDSFARLGEDMETEFDHLAPQLHDILASASVAANELSLATTEVRHSPWRLLYRPSTEELEYENLYFAANRFALASAQLKMASEAIDRAIAGHREYLNDHPQELEEMLSHLQQTWGDYQQAHTDLLDILKPKSE